MKEVFANSIAAMIFCLFGSTNLFAQQYPEMISVAGGEFIMGDQQLVGFSDEVPPHVVFVDNFKIGKTEVTVAQWKVYCADSAKEMPKAPDWGWIDNYPMSNISWNDAMAYCNWLSTKTGKHYRLPTEAEWEYAAQGGQYTKGYKYSGGQWLDSVGWFNSNSKEKPQPVAQKRPNELGLYDMSGNVIEWTMDWGIGTYTAAKTRNPKGEVKGTEKILKGGAYNYAATLSRISYRLSWEPDTIRMQFGLRMVCTD
jgi:formylglycine-generating enzyme